MQTVLTSRGPVVFRGATAASERPVLVLIRGFFPSPDMLIDSGETFPDTDFVWADLPGIFCPFHAENSLRAFGAAFDEAIELAFPGRRVVVWGLSLGGTVALYMRSPLIKAIYAVDPPLQTGGLWPLDEHVRRRIRDEPEYTEWCWSVLGMGATDDRENRDYRDALTGLRAPTRVLIAGRPLEPPREFVRTPGLIAAEDRQLIRATPGIHSTLLVDMPHNIPGLVRHYMDEQLRLLLNAVAA